MPILSPLDPRVNPPFVKKLCGMPSPDRKHICMRVKGHPDDEHVEFDGRDNVSWTSRDRDHR